MTENQNDHPPFDWPATLKKVIIAGYICLAISSLCLYLSIHGFGGDGPSRTASALWMMTARTAGMGAFFIGALSLFNQRWIHGIVLFLGSVVLPMLSLYVRGFI
ncbi:MAG: hypothetical protein KDD55_12920 [Bdellovibrionales bacterium]|nr:hypothetical protein [Bdellovibrionales bacterium]